MIGHKKLAALVVMLTVTLSGSLVTSGIAATNSTGNNTLTAEAVDSTSNFTDISLSVGSNPTDLNLTWYSLNSKGTATVQVALKSDYNGTSFPADKARVFTGTTSLGNNGFTSYKVNTNGFAESTQYVYRLGDGTNWSPVYNYNTYQTSQYSFFYMGDPQIGAGGDIAKDTAGWVDTMNKATKQFPSTNFMVSIGDQINNGGELNGQSNELEYSGYFAPDQLKNIPIAAIAGNHETYGAGHTTHFDAPNMSTQYGNFASQPTSGADYYFTYGNTLFMALNSNDMNEAEHEQFMKDAIAKNPNATWKIVLMHHSIYSSANHETDADIIQRRGDLPPIIDSLGIDVVLDGHDHEYTRTYQMKGGQAQKVNVDAEGRVIDPAGTLYMTANSASGSKYYKLQDPNNNYYEAKKEQLNTPTFSRVSVTSDSFTITTYRADNMTITDNYTIVKSTAPQQAAVNVNDQINNLPNADSISLNDADKVQAARNAYNALDASQQKFTTNLDKLTADESKIAQLQAAAKQQADKQAADAVIAAINAIPDNIVLDANKKVSDADAAYNALTPAQKALVTNYSKLDSAKKDVAKLQQSTSNGSAAGNNSDSNSSATSNGTSTSTTPTTTSVATTLPKTGQFVDQNVLIALGVLLIAMGSAVMVIYKKKINLKDTCSRLFNSFRHLRA
ncbi:purple acid phosphatase family protein [Clostridium pasteurianum]|uniref:Putative phosphohydrolase n=1 Tax=Clostridium pasteurianum BC1 TaxID=86416 RepID=R4K6T8_CLOPA|nr:metallophosphoesterase family protein [Clostridium pasteurianum]AGK95355.1 putative phosphohydrolase [Clostridium pasteurianum BC1]